MIPLLYMKNQEISCSATAGPRAHVQLWKEGGGLIKLGSRDFLELLANAVETEKSHFRINSETPVCS